MELTQGTAFLGGLLTFASPCVLPLIPIYLSVLLGSSVEEASGPGKRFKLLLNGTMFTLGFMLVFVGLGLTASAAGRFLIVHRLLFQQIGGMLVFFFALKFLGLIRPGVMDGEKRLRLDFGADHGISPLAALLIGFTFAFGWTPCISPILGSILMLTAVSSTKVLDGVWFLLLYGLGIAAPLLLVAVFGHSGTARLRKLNRFIPKIEKGTGVVLAALSVLMVTDSVGLLTFQPGGESSEEISMQMVREGLGKKDTPSPLVGEGIPRTIPSPSVGEGRVGGPLAGTAECTPETAICGVEGETPATPDPSPPNVSQLTKGPAVIEFYKPDCPACLRMYPVILGLEETCTGLGLKVIQVDVSTPENRRLASQLAVIGTPTLLFFDGTGREVSRLIGYQELDAVRRAAAVLMGEPCADFMPME